MTKETNESIKQYSENKAQAYKEGRIIPKVHRWTEDEKTRMSKIRSEYLMNHDGSGFKDIPYYKVKNIEGKEYSVRGSWELKVAEKLNELGIKWIRNHILKYRRPDESKERFYNPDFYLPNENIFIEVKGYYSEKDKEKMECVLLHNPNAKIKMIFQKELEMLMDNSIELAQIPFLSL